MDLDHFVSLLSPPHSRSEVLARPSPVRSKSGLYAWTFRAMPGPVPTSGCVEIAGRPLLYIGIAPSRTNSRRTLRDRLRTHYAGNAAGSTLRLTLGCLLGLPLAQRGRRLTFGTDGERTLSAWMEENAFVSWVGHARPWEIESQLLAMHAPPLNIQGNGHAFVPHLRGIARPRAPVRARLVANAHEEPGARHRALWQGESMGRSPNAGPTVAKDAYTGAPFKVNRAYAERFGDAWVVLSAKHGFVGPDELIPEPYDVTFKRRSSRPVAMSTLQEQVRNCGLDRYTNVIGLGGKEYRAAVEAAFTGTSVRLRFPFAGLALGQTMKAIRSELAGSGGDDED